MSLIQKLSNSILSNPKNIFVIVSLLTIFGTLVELSGGIWDVISHVMKEPEFFWTIQHITLYSGVAMIGTSGILGSILLIKKTITRNLKKGIWIVIIGSILSISAGFADSLSHDLFGIDGLISWSHQSLELGLVFSALGGFLILKNISIQKFKKIEPISIMVLILSICWLGFNLSLLVGNTILCMPIYEMFSSGCAIL